MNKSGVAVEGIDSVTLRSYTYEIAASNGGYIVKLVNGETLYIAADSHELFVKGGPAQFYAGVGRLVVSVPMSSILYVIPPHKGE